MTDATDPRIFHLDAVQSDRRGVGDMGDDGANHTGVGDNQAMLSAVLLNDIIVGLAYALDKPIDRLGTGRSAVNGVLIETSVFLWRCLLNLGPTTAFPTTESHFFKPFIDTNWKPIFSSD